MPRQSAKARSEQNVDHLSKDLKGAGIGIPGWLQIDRVRCVTGFVKPRDKGDARLMKASDRTVAPFSFVLRALLASCTLLGPSEHRASISDSSHPEEAILVLVRLSDST